MHNKKKKRVLEGKKAEDQRRVAANERVWKKRKSQMRITDTAAGEQMN